MSVSNFLNPPIKFSNDVYFNNVECNSINGQPVPGSLTQNPKIIYRPGGTSLGNVYATWQEIIDQSAVLNNIVDIYFDDVNSLPEIDVSYDFTGGASFYPYKSKTTPFTNIQINDTVQIFNLRAVHGQMGLLCDNASGNESLVFNPSSSDVFVLDGAIIDNTPNSTARYIDVNTILRISLSNGSGIIADGGLSSIAINIGDSAQLFISSDFGCYLQPDCISGDETTTINFYGDASQNVQTQTSQLGAQSFQLADNAVFVNYDDAVNPVFPLNANDVQDALDSVKQQISLQQPAVIYQQGGTSSGNVVATWAEVVAVCDAYNQMVNVYFDGTLNGGFCEISSSYDFKSRTSFYGTPFIRSSGSGPLQTARILNGVVLTDLKQICEGLTVDVRNSNGSPVFAFSPNAIFFLTYAGITNNNGVSTGPAIDVTSINPNNLIIQLVNGASIATSASHPIINVGTGGALFELLLAVNSSMDDNSISSTDGSAILDVFFDSSCLIGTQSTFTGTSSINLLDQSLYVNYNDILVSPPLGYTNVQGAIDALKTSVSTVKSGFRAFVSPAGLGNVTGDGTAYTIAYANEDYDLTNNYDNFTYTFTAPVLGRYVVSANILLSNMSVAHTSGQLILLLNGTNYYDSSLTNPYLTGYGGAGGDLTMRVSTIVQLAATNTLKMILIVTGGTKTINLTASSGNPFSFFAVQQV